jgi:hypothetical protein
LIITVNGVDGLQQFSECHPVAFANELSSMVAQHQQRLQ